MRIVIQCAGAKDSKAGTFALADGSRIVFVAHPDLAPAGAGILHVHPDQASDIAGKTWRDRVAGANAGSTAPSFLPAGHLYSHPAYKALERRSGPERLFILSAGWGLVRADFRLPTYDITFSGSADPHCRRRSTDKFMDFNALVGEPPDNTVFLGGKDYLHLFLRLTAGIEGRRLVLYNSNQPPRAPGCIVRPYITARRTNWHYDCARDIARGALVPTFDSK